MPDQAQMFTDVRSVAQEIADAPLRENRGRRGVAEYLMRMMSSRGYTLEQLSGPLMMGRSIGTLQAIAREAQIAFPDYVPFDMRPVVEFDKTGDFYVYAGEQAQAVADALSLVNQKGEVGIAAHAAPECRKALKAKFFRVKGLPNG